MNVLFIADRERFWAHFVPVARRLVELGHSAHAAIPWSPRHGPGLVPLAPWLHDAGVRVHWISPGNRHLRLPQLLQSQRWDAVLVCPEHLVPMHHVKAILTAQRSGLLDDLAIPVIAMQHGLWQQFGPQTVEYCDAFLAWGPLTAELLVAGVDSAAHVPITCTGTPKFDSYHPEDAEDHGFVLAHAGHSFGRPSRATPEWIRHVYDACRKEFPGKRVVIKVHCNDDSRLVRPELPDLTFASLLEHPRDLIRTCHALYLDYGSTAWVEALCYGKHILLDGRAAEELHDRGLNDALSATGSAAIRNIIAAIAQQSRCSAIQATTQEEKP